MCIARNVNTTRKLRENFFRVTIVQKHTFKRKCALFGRINNIRYESVEISTGLSTVPSNDQKSPSGNPGNLTMCCSQFFIRTTFSS